MYPINILKTLFVPGLWFNPDGPIGEKLQERFERLTVLRHCGMDLKSRVKNLKENIHPTDETTIVGHSAGCVVILEAMKELPAEHNIKNIILMNPAPVKGIKFGFKDELFWKMMYPPYVAAMMFGKKFELTPTHVGQLLSIQKEKLPAVCENFTPDSGKFARELVLNQFKQKERITIPKNIKLSVLESEGDMMIGSTIKQTIHHLRLHNSGRVTTTVRVGGHLWALQNAKEVVDYFAPLQPALS
ncbi:MAG: alpha/beta hydrolase [Patescibacteria group bacterium]